MTIESEEVSLEILKPWSYLIDLNDTKNSKPLNEDLPIVQVVQGLGKMFKATPKIVEKLSEILRDLHNVSLVTDDLLFEAGCNVKSANSVFGVPVTVTASNYSSTEIFKKVLDLDDGQFFLDFATLIEKEAESVGREIILKRETFKELPTLEKFEIISSTRARVELEFALKVLHSFSSQQDLEAFSILIQNIASLLSHLKDLKNLKYDISCGRMNSIIVHALENKRLKEEEKAELISLMGNVGSNSMSNGIKILEECGAIDETKKRFEAKREEIFQYLKNNFKNDLSKELVEILSSFKVYN